MLNELRDLSQSLKEAGIVEQDWHPFFDTCVKNARVLQKEQDSNMKRPKKTSGYLTYRIFLGKGGVITAFAGIPPDEDITDTRKWKQNNNNGFSFPAFNVSPLFKPNKPDDFKILSNYKKTKRDEAIDWTAEIVRIISDSTPVWTKSEYNRINRCLKEVE